jgi:hypothetical protein
MGSLDAEYDFEDIDRQLLAKELSSLDGSEASFNSYKEKLAIVYRHKSKAFKTEQEKSFQEKLEAELAKRISNTAKASEIEKTIEVETALANAKTENTSIPAQNIDVTEAAPSWKEKIAKAFDKKNITINY